MQAPQHLLTVMSDLASTGVLDTTTTALHGVTHAAHDTVNAFVAACSGGSSYNGGNAAAGDNGILGLVGAKIDLLRKVLISAAVVIALTFVLMRVVKAKGAIAAVLSVGVSAAVFLVIVMNTNFLQKAVENEICPSTSAATVVHQSELGL